MPDGLSQTDREALNRNRKARQEEEEAFVFKHQPPNDEHRKGSVVEITTTK